MMYEKGKTICDRLSGEWPEEALATTATLLAMINQLENRVEALEDQLLKNSRNSSKSPSQDVNRPVKRDSGEEYPKQNAGVWKKTYKFEYGPRVKALADYFPLANSSRRSASKSY